MRVLLLLVLLGVGVECFACAGAGQTRILPIGTLGNDMVAMHLDIHRTDHGPDHVKGEKPKEWWWWLGRAKLVSFNMSSLKISKIYANDSIAWHHLRYGEEIAATFNRHLKLASKIKGLQLLAPEEISICNFAPTCKQAYVGYSPDSSKLIVTATTGNARFEMGNALMKDSTTVLPYWTYDERYMENATQFFPLESMMYYTIGSTRLYTIGNRKLLVVHLGASSDGHVPDEQEFLLASPESIPDYPKFDKLENTTYDEPVLWHGLGFDVLVWLN